MINLYSKKIAGILTSGLIIPLTGITQETIIKKPNILWISCEDISCNLGCYSDTIAKTPNLDKLAAEGIRYTNAYSCAGVSAPSRCGIITGMYPTSIGGHNMRTQGNTYESKIGIPGYSIVPPPEVKCFSEYLRLAGYYCTNNEKTDYQFETPITAWDNNSNTAHWKDCPKDKSFFSVFNIITTHESRIKENSWMQFHVLPNEVNIPPFYPDHPKVRIDIARNYSNIAIMDAEVGMILKDLENEGLLESTIIVFFSDNGGPLPRGKRELYDNGIRLPLIIRFPNKEYAGTVVNDLISYIDFAPTMLSLAGIKPPDYLQGQAFLGKYKTTESRKYIFAARDRMDTEYDMVRAVRDIRFKYIKNYHPELPFIQNISYRIEHIPMMNVLLDYNQKGLLQGNQKYWFSKTKPLEELYDCLIDPYELNNLAENKDYTNILKELRNALGEWQEKYGDKGFIPEKELIQQMWNGNKQPITDTVYLIEQNGKIELKCNTLGASITYTFNNPEKNINWQLYNLPLNKTDLEGKILYTLATRIGYIKSKVNKHIIK